ncbi:MAG: hypothetical protein R2726_18790 [Acidimicrobiales bacterium]
MHDDTGIEVMQERRLLPPVLDDGARRRLTTVARPPATPSEARSSAARSVARSGGPWKAGPVATSRPPYGRLDVYVPWWGWEARTRRHRHRRHQMTVCVAEWLLAHDGDPDPADLAARFVDWYPIARGEGRACTAAVHNLMDGLLARGRRRIGRQRRRHARRSDRPGAPTTTSTRLRRWPPSAQWSPTRWPWPARSSRRTSSGGSPPSSPARSTRRGHPPGPHRHRRPPRAGRARATPRRRPRTAGAPRRRRRVGDWLDAEPGDAFDHFYNGAFVLEGLPSALWCFCAAGGP